MPPIPMSVRNRTFIIVLQEIRDAISSQEMVFLRQILGTQDKRESFEITVVPLMPGTMLPFTYAINLFNRHKQPEVVELMIKSGMDYLLEDRDGNSAASLLLPAKQLH